MLRIEADALQAHLAIALFAFLDARADARLAIEQSRTLTRAVSSGHDDSTGRKRSVPQIANELASLTWDPTSGSTPAYEKWCRPRRTPLVVSGSIGVMPSIGS